MPELPLADDVKKPLSTPKTADDIADSFKEVIEEEEKKAPKKAKEEKEEPEEEGDELELVDDEEDEEPLDLTEDEPEDDKIKIDTPPRKKEILAKYPNVFKDFPFLEKVLYRDRQYNELFGSFDDAKEIAEKADVFSEFESQLLSGNTEEVLKNVKESDPKAFDKIVDSYLKTLAKVDKDAYFEVTGNIAKQLIIEMVSEAKKSQNEDLQNAAVIINQFLFGTSEFKAPKPRVEAKPENDEAEKERLAFVQERFESSRDDLQSRTDNTIRSTIAAYIDPKEVMSGYLKKNAVNDTMDNLAALLGRDPSFQKNLDRLWRAAFDSKFSRESLGKIQSFYLGKAKQLLPTAMKKARAEALKDLAPRAKKEEEQEEEQEVTPRKRGPIRAGITSQPKKNERKPGESVAEFLARD